MTLELQGRVSRFRGKRARAERIVRQRGELQIGDEFVERRLLSEQRSCCSPGAATGIFDDGISEVESAVFLRTRNHRQRHAVFHATGRIFALDSCKNA